MTNEFRVNARRAATCIALALSIAATSRAAEDPSPGAILEMAIKAKGGKEAIVKHNAVTWSEKGTYYGMGEGLPFTGKYFSQLPDQFRFDIEGAFVMVLDRDKGWVKNAAGTTEMTKDQLAGQKEHHYVGWIGRLAPLSDKAFKLADAGKSKVGDRPALGIRVSRDGHRDVTLWFDKETWLLVRSVSVVKSPELGGKEVEQVATFAEFKEFAGLKLATKIVIQREGKPFVDAELSDIKPVEKLDDKTFAKP